MSEKVGFITMGEVADPTPESLPEIGVGMLGYSFMGKTHSNAYRTMPYIFWPPPAVPRLVAICGRQQDRVSIAARRYGFSTFYTDWHELIADDRVQLFDNVATNAMHCEPTIAAALHGKHVLCEKPLGRSVSEARYMLDAVRQAGVKHAISFNYRFIPAVRLARHLIEEGKLGQIYHFRATYQQEWMMDPNLPYVYLFDREGSGDGMVGGIGSHIIDLARFLVGEPVSTMAVVRSFSGVRRFQGEEEERVVEVPEAFESILDFEQGAIGVLAVSGFCQGRKNREYVEINGSKGSLYWDLENLNELYVHFHDDPQRETGGFRRVSVTEAYHDLAKHWWPQGHIIGWEHTFVHEVEHLIRAIVRGDDVAPYGATFLDGYRTNVIQEAIVESAASGKRVPIVYGDGER